MALAVRTGPGRPATPPPSPPRPRRRGEDGQILALLLMSLFVVVAMAGLLIDGGRAFSDQRQAQAAADTGALAAASAASVALDPVAAARAVAIPNGFYNAGATDCNGAALPGGGVEVNTPPTSGPHAGEGGYVEVLTARAMRTGFAGAIGFSCWMIRGRAVATIATSAVATCTFCILGNEDTPTLGLHGSESGSAASLRVDGDVYVNKANWTTGTAAVNRCAGSNPCTPPSCVAGGDPWVRPGSNSGTETMCGSSFVLHNSNGGDILWSARSISVGGGWFSWGLGHRIQTDQLAAGCQYHPDVNDWLPTLPNVCIGMPPIVDPLNDPADPGNIVTPPDPSQLSVPVAGANGCPAGSAVPVGTLANPQRLTVSGAAYPDFVTICPGIYYGGFTAIGDTRNVKVTMMPGIYYMVGGGASGGGGFVVSGTASIDGSAGVFIYLTGGTESFTESTSPGTGLVPACTSGTCLTPSATLTTSDSTIAVNTNVTFTLRVTGTPVPTGNVTFYDGQDAIAGCANVAITLSGSIWRATCTTQFPQFGTRGITGVYFGDSVYKAVGPTLNQTVVTSTNSTAGTFNVNTTTSPCSLPGGVACGEVILHAPDTGPYAGLLVFQGRLSGLGMTIWPAAGAPACTGNWMTDGVPPNTNPVPAPCGPLGGMSGTIYAPHLKTGGSGDHDAGINFRTSGLANLQIITGSADLTFAGNMRLTWLPNQFANGTIHLVE